MGVGCADHSGKMALLQLGVNLFSALEFEFSEHGLATTPPEAISEAFMEVG